MPDFTRIYHRKGVIMSEEKEFEIIKTIDDDGNEVELKLVEIVTVDDIDYALLLPSDADIDKDEECDVVLMRLKQEGNEYSFEVIEDQDEFDLVSQAILDSEE